MYSSERNVQMLLSLLKAHKIKKMVLSPGSANASFVASAQYDGEFELYSSVDERSAAYIACGLAEESQEPVVICCTGATASRNYMPGLTEAYYRKLPVIAVTATRPIAWLGQNRDQLIDRTVIPKDIAVKSVHLPVIENEQDEWECNLKINDALLELRRNGGGPVHINLTTSYSLDFSVSKLPEERVIQRVDLESKLPELSKEDIAIFVGAHSVWNEKLKASVESFCEEYNAFVFYDQTSNYTGKYGIPCGVFDIAGFPNLKINLLMRFYDVDKGSITIDGKDIRDISRKNLRSSYGMVLQETWLRNTTVRENIAFGKPDATDEEIENAAKASYAHNFIKRLPKGYDTVIGEDGGSLSQGQKQLLCIARVMLCLPPMLILDEATSSIDTRTEVKIQDAFSKMMEGRTTFIVAHRLSTIKEADVILVMKDGKIIEQGNHEELLEKRGFYYKLYNS